MMNMQSFPDRIRKELYNSIEYARKEQFDFQEQNILYGHKPTDFSRLRKLDFNTIVKILIHMQGGSLQKELYKTGLNVSASAFVQRRKQLSWRDIERFFIKTGTNARFLIRVKQNRSAMQYT